MPDETEATYRDDTLEKLALVLETCYCGPPKCHVCVAVRAAIARIQALSGAQTAKTTDEFSVSDLKGVLAVSSPERRSTKMLAWSINRIEALEARLALCEDQGCPAGSELR